MFSRLLEFILPPIIGVMVHKKETLTSREEAIVDSLIPPHISARETTKPLMVGMVGLVGSGKSSVARTVAPIIGAVIVEGDVIRVALRKYGIPLERTRLVGEHLAREIINRGGNVIFDSDHVDQLKRSSVCQVSREVGGNAIFVAVTCDYDVMAGRIISTRHEMHPNDFFGGASSVWKGDQALHGSIVKLRELWRRTPQHFRWVNKIGGQWVAKKLPFKVYAEIDTTKDLEWPQYAKGYARHMLSF